ncbi:MAG: hypothetical protein M1827_002473 [Pycnora praestabilis]|nr:MAG: hypothetical protein M1827_002473 [Pycnora praestabilis]
MECAGRGLAFWSYQATQEVVYQEYLAKTLTEKYTNMSTQMDKIIHDANSEISSLHNKLSALELDQDNLQKKNHELVEAFREKSRKHLQTQELYNKLKRRTLLAQVQTAASDSVDQTYQPTSFGPLHGAVGSLSGNQQVPAPATSRRQRQNQVFTLDQQASQRRHLHQRTGSDGSGGSGGNMGQPYSRSGAGVGNPWNNLASSGFGSLADPMSTPSQHRQRLPAPRHPAQNQSSFPAMQSGSILGSQNQHTPLYRQPLNDLNPNAPRNSGLTGCGMSAGMKIGRHQVNGNNASQRPNAGATNIATFSTSRSTHQGLPGNTYNSNGYY